MQNNTLIPKLSNFAWLVLMESIHMHTSEKKNFEAKETLQGKACRSGRMVRYTTVGSQSRGPVEETSRLVRW